MQSINNFYEKIKGKRNNGFTLVEIIVVLVVLAIVTAIVVPVTLSIIDNSRENDAKNAAKNIMNAVQSEFNQLAVDNEFWNSIQGKMAIILNKNRKNRDTELFADQNEFKSGFINISNTLPVDNIFNKIENPENIVTLYVGAGNANYYELECENPNDRKKMYIAYVIAFQMKDDDNVYFYNGKEISTKWPFSTPGFGNNEVKNHNGQKFQLLNNDTRLQIYALRIDDGYEPDNYWKSVVMPKVVSAQ